MKERTKVRKNGRMRGQEDQKSKEKKNERTEV